MRGCFRIRMGKVGWRISELSAENAHLLREGNQITNHLDEKPGRVISNFCRPNPPGMGAWNLEPENEYWGKARVREKC